MKTKILGVCCALWSICLLPTVVDAKTLVVLPIRYGDGSPNTEASASRIGDIIAKAASASGYMIVKGPAVLDALRGQNRLPAQCDSDCMVQLAEQLGAEDVIVVEASDEAQATYSFSVTFAYRESFKEERTAGFFVVLEWLKGALTLSLKADRPASDDAEPSADILIEPPEEPAPQIPESLPSSDSATEGRRRLSSRTPFLVSAGVTTALVVTFLVLDGAVNSKYNQIKDQQSITGELDMDEISAAESLQTAEKVVLGVAVAGAVTTGILALFTDFKRADQKDSSSDTARSGARFRAGVAASSDGAAFQLRGRF